MLEKVHLKRRNSPAPHERFSRLHYCTYVVYMSTYIQAFSLLVSFQSARLGVET